MKSRSFLIGVAAGLGAALVAVPDASGQARYRVAQEGDVVTLSDTRATSSSAS